jgi:HAD superfamily hydrolase (TIGR01484 family)
MNKDLKYLNYKQAIKQNYCAVCLDVDGTLTLSTTKKIDERVFKPIAKILNSNIPVFLITGRGETGLDNIKKDLLLPMLDKKLIMEDKLKNFYVLTNDGARLFTSTLNGNNYFNHSEYLCDKKDIIKLYLINEKIKRNEFIKENSNISYSFDGKTNQIINIRFNLLKRDEEIEQKLIDIINGYIKDFRNISLTHGIYNGKKVFQIGTYTKGLAINKIEQLISIPKNSMLCIGDCGDENGNDYSFLNTPQGFSVLKYSLDDDKCFPVFDYKGNIIIGVEATLYLLERVKLIHTICLEKADEKKYQEEYSLVEKRIVVERDKYLEKFNKKVNKIYGTIDGINSLFDSNIGGVIIPMYEMELIPSENPLKRFWLSNENNNLIYSLRDNLNYILRGSQTYYYFLAHRISKKDEKSQKDIEITTNEDVINWLYNYYIFTIKAFYAIGQTKELNESNNRKMVLGILDNIRNFLLIIINEEININFLDKNVIINLQKNNDDYLNKYYETILLTEKMMIDLSFNEMCNIDSKDVLYLINEAASSLLEFIVMFPAQDYVENYSKLFRCYREIDNFAENYICSKIMSEKHDDTKEFGICGISYGGNELPIIYKCLKPSLQDVCLLKFGSNADSYKNKHAIEIRNFDIKNYGELILEGVNKNIDYILEDDNVLTAKTMQLGICVLNDIGISVENVLAVRYPSINRVSQMFMDGHGAVDYKYFFNYIKGLCFSSPYTWKDENENLYEDSLGVFDISRRKILECLYKNHDYRDKTEVERIREKKNERND